MIDSGKIRPTVFEAYEGLESVPKALDDLSNRKVSGKAVIRLSREETDDSKAKL